ncbi:Ulp1 protease family protein [Aspergillus terreus]|uniref:Ulp1 protease family protein n=1 Tax=Aspergillus terreus TaxID=33178 RepID=A0A5M3Z6D3_ASPTE|nr:hypothetical protein ATETN484_0009050300 [Aspergillus terreus]GFF17954.1 Ulp1 protease family protein [Aspergillus terreus]
MAGVFATQQSEMEDVIMQDASLLSANSPRAGMDDSSYVYDPMDISPIPTQPRPRISPRFGFASSSINAHAPPSRVGFAARSSHQLGAPRAPVPPIRSTFIKPLQRFSPNSRARTTTGHFGLNNQTNSWAKPAILNTRLPSTRDSSFTSLNTNHSTFDRKSFSFDSFTTFGTADATSRKRSIDEDIQIRSPTSEEDNRLSTKYRRVSINEFPDSAILAQSTEVVESRPAEPALPVHVSPPSTDLSAAAPSSSLQFVAPVTLHSPGHVAYGNIPGMWPEQSPMPLNSHLTSTANPGDSAHTSNALAPAISPAFAPVARNDAEVPPTTTSTLAKLFSACEKYSMAIVKHFKSVTETVSTYAGSVGRRAAGLFQRRVPRPARRSPHASPTRVNLHALPAEQRRQIRDNQRRRERGSPAVEEYPFPDLTIDFPTFPVGGPSSTTAAGPSPPSNTPPSHRRISTGFSKERRQHRGTTRTGVMKHGQLKQSSRREQKSSVLGPVSPKKKRSNVNPKVSPNLKRRIGLINRRNPEQARRAIMLQKALRTSKFDPSTTLRTRAIAASALQKESLARPPASEPLEQVAQPTPVQTEQKAPKRKKVQFDSPLVRIIPESDLVPEIAPFLHPSPDSKHAGDEQKPSDVSAEQKENVPPAEIKVEIEPEDASTVDPWLNPDFLPLGRPVSAVRLFSAPKPLPPGRTESVYAKEWKKIEEEIKKEQRPARIRPEGPAVRPLPGNWARRVADAMAQPSNRQIATTLAGDPLTKRDLATCYTPMAWLNDEVINAYMALIVDYLRRTHGNSGRHDKPRFHAFNSFFFSSLRDKGYQGVRRWASRAKIGGEHLLNVDVVFVPVHNSAHWTLIVVKPSERTIEHFDSLGSLSLRHVKLIKDWLKNELGGRYVEEEWAVLPSVSPQQDNGSDCGAFLLSTAKAVAIGIEPLSYGAADIPLLRRKIVAELMAGGLEGDFDPASSGEVLL